MAEPAFVYMRGLRYDRVFFGFFGAALGVAVCVYHSEVPWCQVHVFPYLLAFYLPFLIILIYEYIYSYLATYLHSHKCLSICLYVCLSTYMSVFDFYLHKLYTR